MENSPLPIQGNDPVGLAPTTERKLVEFRRRRTALLLWRGFGLTLIVSVVAIVVAIILDAWLLHSAARWIGAAVVYGATLCTFLWRCVYPATRTYDMSADARRLEQLDPRLRHRLLSAVELSQAASPAVTLRHAASAAVTLSQAASAAVTLSEAASAAVDSSAFRKKLQTQVAGLLSALDMQEILPWSLVQVRFTQACVALVGFLLACFIPGLYFPQRLARVLLPAMDLARVSRISIAIERPNPQSRVVPCNDIVAITALVSGPRPESLVLETESSPGQVLTTSMNFLEVDDQHQNTHALWGAHSRFEALVTAANAPLRYRALGAGAHTPWYTLTPKERPRVQEFFKQVTPPTYAHARPNVSRDDHGNLSVLQGSQIELRISTNQSTNTQELHWLSTSNDAESLESKPILLQRDAGSNLLVCNFMAEESTSFKVHLQSNETGFTNEFSPTYTLNVLQDLPPSTTWVRPETAELVASAEQILSMSCSVTDELPLASVETWTRINQSQWQKSSSLSPVPLEMSTDHQRQTIVHDWQLDLASVDLKPGDQLDVKLLALDRRGQSTESSVLEIKISQVSLTTKPQPAELLRREVAQSLDELAEKLLAAKREIENLNSESSQEQPGKQLEHARAKGLQFATELRQDIEKSLERTQHAAALAGGAANSQYLVDVGNVLVSLKAVATEIERTSTAISLDSVDAQGQELSPLQKSLAASSQRATELAKQFQVLTTMDVLTRHSREFSLLAQAERSLISSTTDQGQTVEQLSRRQQVLTLQMKEAYQSVVDSLPWVRPETQPSLQRNAALLSQQIDLAEQLQQFSTREAVERVAQSVVAQLERLQMLSQLDSSLFPALRASQRRLAELSPNVAEILSKLGNSRANDEVAPVAAEQLSARRAIERAAEEGDRVYAGDLGAAQRALQRLASEEASTQNQTTDDVQAISRALRTLQAVHRVEQLDGLLSELLKQERWSANEFALKLHTPALWEALSSRTEIAWKSLRQAELPVEIVNALADIQKEPAFHQTGQALLDRLQQPQSAISVVPQLERLDRQLSDVRKELSIQAEIARKQLALYAPKISELARKAAQETRFVESESKQLIESIDRKEVPNVPIRVEQLEVQSRELSNPMASLRESLVDQADAQNLLDRKQTQIARQADAGLEIVDQIDERLQSSLAEVDKAVQSTDPSNELKAAAEGQSRSAQALEQLAMHFEAMEKAPDASVARTEFQDLLNELSGPTAESASSPVQPTRNSQSKQRYQYAEELAQLAAQNPASVLQQLEEELKTSPPMAAEMSHIARQAAENALQNLREAAREQQQLSIELETSDPQFQYQKELLLHDLSMVRDGVSQMLTTVAQEAQWTAGASKSESQAQRLSQADRGLRDSLTATRDIGPHQPLESLRTAAQALQSELEDTEQQLQIAAQELSQRSFEEIHQNGADLNNRRREMRDRQRRIQQQAVRDSQNTERSEQQQLRQAEEAVRQAEQSLQDILAQVQLVRQQFEQMTASNEAKRAELRDQLTEHQRSAALGQAKLAAVRELREAVERRLADAQSLVEMANQRELSPLTSVNPTAELSAQLSQHAAEATRTLAQKLREWEQKPLSPLRASSQQLQIDERQQASVRDSVENAAENLSRAGRHEARLENSAVSSQLGRVADATRQVAEQSIQTAQEQISASIKDALSSDIKTGDIKTGDIDTGQASAAATAATRAAFNLATEQINSVAESVRAMLAEQASNAKASPAASPPSNSDAASPTSPSPLDAQQKAQLLDELDRQINSELNLGEKEDNSQPSPSSGEPTEQSAPGTLSDAAKQLAKSMSESRQAPTESPRNTDIGMATESQTANVNPQPPVAVRVIEIERGAGQWGQLRTQTPDALLETQRETISPRYRKQVEAYFRELAERGQMRE